MSLKVLSVIIADDGRIAVDIELPEGEQCDALDAGLRTFLAAMGIMAETAVLTIRRVPVAEGTAEPQKESQ